MNGSRSIGVSNFGVQDLSILMASAKVKPAAHQASISSLQVPFESSLGAITYTDYAEPVCLLFTSSHHGILGEAWDSHRRIQSIGVSYLHVAS